MVLSLPRLQSLYVPSFCISSMMPSVLSMPSAPFDSQKTCSDTEINTEVHVTSAKISHISKSCLVVKM